MLAFNVHGVASDAEVLFDVGACAITPGVKVAVPAVVIHLLIRRHSTGDWGELDAFDIRQNRNALRDGHRLLSSYQLTDDLKVFVITEWDRSRTTVLLSEEY